MVTQPKFDIPFPLKRAQTSGNDAMLFLKAKHPEKKEKKKDNWQQARESCRVRLCETVTNMIACSTWRYEDVPRIHVLRTSPRRRDERTSLFLSGARDEIRPQHA